MKAWIYAGMGLLGLLAVVAAALAVVRSTPDEAEEDNILLGDWLVDPTCSFIADQVIVHFKENRPTGEVLEIISDHDAYRIREYLDLGGGWLVRVPEDKRDELRGALERNPAVEYAELSALVVIDPRYGLDPCDALTPQPLDLDGR